MKNLQGLLSFSVNLIGIALFSCNNAQITHQKGGDDTNLASTLIDTQIMEIEESTPAVSFTLDELLGKVHPSDDTSFVKVAAKYGSKNDLYLRKEAYQAFIKMYNAAREEGVQLRIISATRTFYHQKSIWEAKWTGKRLVGGQNLSFKPAKERAQIILRYSSMPGSSRHHWGTDIDLNDLNNSYFETGIGFQLYQWMEQNAYQYGFCQPYTAKDSVRPNGYEEEKWHWTYQPTASKMLEAYKESVTNEMIKGFEGAETAVSIDIVKNYVCGINPECK